jgi:hypothetical protein
MTPGIGTARHCHGPAWRSRQSKAAPATGRRLWPERSDRSRPLTAKADIALVCRDLGWALKPLDAAYKDHANAAHARHLKARYLLLIGRLDEAERLLAAFDPTPRSPASRASFDLVNAGIAMRGCASRRPAPRWRRQAPLHVRPASHRSQPRSKVQPRFSTFPPLE